MSFDLQGKKIWVAGHNGMVGRALLKALAREPCELLTVDRETLDLRHQEHVRRWMQAHKPDAVIIAAARVGGIAANSAFPAEFLYDNITIAGNIIHAAYEANVQKLIFLGSSCIYPKMAPQPMTEAALLTSALEPTNQWYATAKIAGLMLCEAYRRQYGCNFISAMPANLYGPHDHFDPQWSHVIPGLMHKFHQAKTMGLPTVTIWGTGTPRREFLHVDDLAQALVLLLREYALPGHINVGYGSDISIAELAAMLADITGFEGELRFDPSLPDGAPRKLLDTSKLTALGWRPSTQLRRGLTDTYQWYLSHVAG